MPHGAARPPPRGLGPPRRHAVAPGLPPPRRKIVGVPDAPHELPGPAPVETPSLAQRPLAQAPASPRDQLQQGPARRLVERRSAEVRALGPDHEVVLLSEQFAKLIRAARKPPQERVARPSRALARLAAEGQLASGVLGVEHFRGRAQVRYAFA